MVYHGILIAIAITITTYYGCRRAVGLNGLGGAAFVSRAPGAIDFACRRVCKNWRTARTVDLFRDQILKVMLDKCTN